MPEFAKLTLNNRRRCSGFGGLVFYCDIYGLTNPTPENEKDNFFVGLTVAVLRIVDLHVVGLRVAPGDGTDPARRVYLDP